MWLYVSPRTSYWGPRLRLGAALEITLLELGLAKPFGLVEAAAVPIVAAWTSRPNHNTLVFMFAGLAPRTTIAFGLLVVTLSFSAACSHAHPRPLSDWTGPGSFLVTDEEIRASGATTAWEALRRTVPMVHLRESRGAPARIQRRGTASLYSDDQPRVFVDEVPIYDLKLFASMPASEIATIEVLNGLDAATRYGGISTSGAIVIRTKKTIR